MGHLARRGILKLAAGAGGLAVGVHTTQFAIRDPRFGLFEPVLALAAEEMDRAPAPVVRIAGICGETKQAAAEASLAAAEAKLRQILNPTAADLSAAESAFRTSEVTLNNARVTVGTTKNSLTASLATYCNVFNAVHVKCDVAGTWSAASSASVGGPTSSPRQSPP